MSLSPQYRSGGEGGSPVFIAMAAVTAYYLYMVSAVWEAGRLTPDCHPGSSKALKRKTCSVSVLSLCLGGGYLPFLYMFSPL